MSVRYVTREGQTIPERDVVFQDYTGKPLYWDLEDRRWNELYREELAPKPDLPPKEKVAVGRLEKVAAEAIAAEEAEEIPTLPLLGRAGYVLERRTTLIASYPKAGKTTLMIPLAKEWLASGHRILYVTEEGRDDWRVRLSGEG
jgi:predicted ATP-dependent serine protease